MKYPAYRKYKKSSVAWLGEIPEHWETKRARFLITVNPSSPILRALDKESEVSFIPMDAVGECGGLKLDQTRIVEEIGGGYTEFQNGDVIVAKITPCFENWKGALANGLENGAAYGTTELHILRVSHRINERFLFYMTLTDGFRKLGEAEMYGAGGQKRVPPDFCKDFLIPLFPKDEQTAIADFLDRETSRLDTLVAKKQALIGLLKEKRTALISQTVTRGLPADAAREFGLQPHMRFRDAGVEWLEKVPEKWENWKMTHACLKICDGTHFSPKSESSGDYMYITAKNIKEAGIDLKNVTFVAKEDHNAIYSKCPVRKGDVLYIKDGATAGIATVNMLEEEFSMLSSVALLRPKAAILEARYFAYQLNSCTFKDYILKSLVGGAMTRFTIEIISDFRIIVPDYDEQQAIANYLDRKITKIDNLIAKIEAAIERLKEYRTALITAAVTGKINVRTAIVKKEAA